jgi:DNA repair protein SbcD/Mre11
MKILHTSDWHIGKSLFGRDLDEDQKYALEQITDHLRQHAYDLLIVAGDIFDRAVPSSESMRLFGRWLGELRSFAPALPIVIIAGNHDNGPRLAWAASLLDEAHVYLRGETDRVDEPIEVVGTGGDCAQVWALPFLTGTSA